MSIIAQRMPFEQWPLERGFGVVRLDKSRRCLGKDVIGVFICSPSASSLTPLRTLG